MMDDDDWESVDIDNLLVCINAEAKECTQKLLEARRLEEEADLALSDELFNDTPKPLITQPIKPIKEKQTQKKITNEKQKQKQQEKLNKEQKEQKLRAKKHEEIFGEGKIDIYEDIYGHLYDT